VSEADQREVERFVLHEARLADEHRYAEWEALWTDDGVYWIPAGSDDADPRTQMSLIHDNRHRIATRIRQLETGRRHAQEPRSRLCRVVSNVVVVGPAGPDGADAEVTATFVLVESRERGDQLWAGRTTYRLRRIHGQLRLAGKKVVLVNNDRVLPTLAFLI
jgi:benzoate/toluate 1,2-dioxygenase subunit beta